MIRKQKITIALDCFGITWGRDYTDDNQGVFVYISFNDRSLFHRITHNDKLNHRWKYPAGTEMVMLNPC